MLNYRFLAYSDFMRVVSVAVATPIANTQGEYTPVTNGPSYIQTVTWGANGPIAEALLGTSQSANFDSPYNREKTRRYSAKNWIPSPFSSAKIATQALVKVLN
jgi:acyl-homoserine-lactone acylase